jgi:hypothetical protein
MWNISLFWNRDCLVNWNSWKRHEIGKIEFRIAQMKIQTNTRHFMNFFEDHKWSFPVYWNRSNFISVDYRTMSNPMVLSPIISTSRRKIDFHFRKWHSCETWT